MNIPLRSRLLNKAISYAALLSLVMLFSVTPVSAGESVFEVGKIYLLNDSHKVKILSKPDKTGWVKVKPMGGGMMKYLGEQGYVNMSQFDFAKEIK